MWHIGIGELRPWQRVAVNHHQFSCPVARHIHSLDARVSVGILKRFVVEIKPRINDANHHPLACVVGRESVVRAIGGDCHIGGGNGDIGIRLALLTHSNLPHHRQCRHFRNHRQGHLRRDHIAKASVHFHTQSLQWLAVGIGKADKRINQRILLRLGSDVRRLIVMQKQLFCGYGILFGSHYSHRKSKHHYR